jgi:hypothetical protein
MDCPPPSDRLCHSNYLGLRTDERYAQLRDECISDVTVYYDKGIVAKQTLVEWVTRGKELIEPWKELVKELIKNNVTNQDGLSDNNKEYYNLEKLEWFGLIYQLKLNNFDSWIKQMNASELWRSNQILTKKGIIVRDTPNDLLNIALIRKSPRKSLTSLPDYIHPKEKFSEDHDGVNAQLLLYKQYIDDEVEEIL